MIPISWLSIAVGIVAIVVVLLAVLRGPSRNRKNYPGIRFTREVILAKLNADFAESDRAFVIAQLERFGPLGTPDGSDRAVAQVCALILADGDPRALPRPLSWAWRISGIC